MYVFVFLSKVGLLSVRLLGNNSAFDMLSKYMYLIVGLVFPTSVFGVGVSY